MSPQMPWRNARAWSKREVELVFVYHFGGIEVTSELPLSNLRPRCEAASGVPAMRVVRGIGNPPAEEKFHYAWNGRFRMRLGECGGHWLVGSPWGAFLVERDASVVRVFGAEGPEGQILKYLFARRLLPRLVKLAGGATYHAASVAQGDRGIIIMGRSGAGKSTMSVALAATKNWDILGDDMALVWNEGAEVIAPAAADVTIWPQSCAGLHLPDEDCSPLVGYDGKRVYHPPRPQCTVPVPLAGIFFIDRNGSGTPALIRCSPADAFTRALKQIIYFNPNGAAAEERVRSVTWLNTLLGRVPAWTLTYPPSFDALHKVSDLLSVALKDA